MTVESFKLVDANFNGLPIFRILLECNYSVECKIMGMENPQKPIKIELPRILHVPVLVMIPHIHLKIDFFVCLFHQVLRDDVLTALWKTMVASGRKGAEEQTSRPKSPLMYTYHDKEYLGI